MCSINFLDSIWMISLIVMIKSISDYLILLKNIIVLIEFFQICSVVYLHFSQQKKEKYLISNFSVKYLLKNMFY